MTLALCVQVGYCGLDRLPFGGDTGPSNSLDIMTYCKGYVAWDLMSLLIQVGPGPHSKSWVLSYPHVSRFEPHQSSDSVQQASTWNIP